MKKNRLLNRTLSFGLALALFLSSPASVYAEGIDNASTETILENISEEADASDGGESSGSESTTASEKTNSETGSESKDSDQVSSGASTSEKDSNSDEQVNKGETPESSDKTADDAEADADKKADAEADSNADKDAEDDDEEITYDYESNNDGTHVKKWVDKDGVAHEETEDCEFGEDGKCVHCGYEKEEEEESVEFVYDGGSVKVVVKLKDKNDLPEGSELSVKKLEITEDIQDKVDEKAIAEKKAVNDVAAYDIKFIKDGEEVEPKNTVSVEVSTPDVNKGDEAAVYHYDDTNDKVEDMNASVNNAGDVLFDTNHFSTYIIINKGGENVNVKINHLGTYIENYNQVTKPIYSTDERKLGVGAIVSDYNKALNWEVYKIEKVVNGTTFDITEDKEEIVVASDTEINVYYKPKEMTYKGETTFYDYVVQPQKNQYVWQESSLGVIWSNEKSDTKPSWWDKAVSATGSNYKVGSGWGSYLVRNCRTEKTGDPNNSINVDSNYANNRKPKLTIGHTGQTFSEQTHDDYLKYNGVNQYFNRWLDNNQKAIYKGIVSGLDDDGNVVFNVDQPSIFTDTSSTGKTVIKDYQLGFKQVGDTYTLDTVYDGKGNVVCSNMYNFFPLDSITPRAEDRGWWDDNHDYYFGMRYDVKFTIGDYVGPLNYTFTGDDDLWVILDGETVVIDLGGVHSAVSGECDLWDYIKDSKTGEYDKNKEHQLTILYMERGANVSNCLMNFTIPNAKVINNSTPQTSVSLTKVDVDDESLKLEGASFKLVSTTNENLISTAVSDENGKITFNSLTVGTYTLTETAAPDGYGISEETWTIEVSLDSDNNAVAVIKDSSGKKLNKNVITNKKLKETVTTETNVNKSASLENWDDRTYKIKLEGESVETKITEVSKEKPVDLILVIDTSKSMDFPSDLEKTTDKQPNTGKIYYEIAQNSQATVFRWEYSGGNWYRQDSSVTGLGSLRQLPDISTLYEKTSISTTRWNHFEEAACRMVDDMADGSQMSIVGFNSKASNELVNSADVFTVTSDNREVIKNTIRNMHSKLNSGTRQDLGLKNALDLLKENQYKNSENDKFVILLTDGCPNPGNNTTEQTLISNATTYANNIKEQNAKIYSIGIDLDINDAMQTAKSLLQACAYSEEYYFNKTGNDLEPLFEAISMRINGKNVSTTYLTGEVKDVVDKRFDLIADNKTKVTSNGSYDIGGATAECVINSDGTTTIIWRNQTLKNWTAEFTIRAKEDFIGGNVITTNTNESGVTVGEDTTNFPEPSVNVKLLDFEVDSTETTVLKNDTFSIPGIDDSTEMIGYLSQIKCSYTDSNGVTHSTANVFNSSSLSYNADKNEYLYSYPGTSDVVGSLAVEGFTGMDITAENLGDNKYLMEYELTYNPIKYVDRNKDGIVEPTHDNKADDSKSAQGAYKVNVVDAGIYALKFGGATKASLDGAEYTVYDENGKALGSFESKTVNNVKGIMLIEGLGVGTYTLKETKAPKGYALSSEEFEIAIARRAESAVGYYTMTITKKINDSNSEVNISSIDFDVIQITDEGLKGYFFDDGMAVDSIPDGYLVKADKNDTTVALNQASNVAFKAYDTIAYTLPETGGSGVYVYTIGGILLMIAGALLLYKNKNNKSK